MPGRKLLITDGVFSMDGDIGPLPALVEVAERYGAIMMIDDAHSSGVLGRNGRGTVDHFGLHGRVDIQVGHAVESRRSAGRIRVRQPGPDRFPVSPRKAVSVLDVPPACRCRVVPRRLRHSRIRAGPDRATVEQHAITTRRHFGQAGFSTGESETPITPIMIGDTAATFEFSRRLFDARVIRHWHRVPDRSSGQGSRPDDRNVRAHDGAAGPRRRHPLREPRAKCPCLNQGSFLSIRRRFRNFSPRPRLLLSESAMSTRAQELCEYALIAWTGRDRNHRHRARNFRSGHR